MLSVHVRMPAPRKRCGKNGTGTGRGGQAEEIIKQKTCLKAIKLKSRFHAAKQALLEGNRYDQCPGEKGALLYFSFFYDSVSPHQCALKHMKDRVLVSHSWPAVSITEQKEMPRCRSGVVRGKVCSGCNCFCISDNKIQEVQVWGIIFAGS